MIVLFMQGLSYLEEIQCRLSAFILKHFSVLLHLNVDTVRKYYFLKKELSPLVVVVYVKICMSE